jgi:hypothetical protein
VRTADNSGWLAQKMPETCRVLWLNKFWIFDASSWLFYTKLRPDNVNSLSESCEMTGLVPRSAGNKVIRSALLSRDISHAETHCAGFVTISYADSVIGLFEWDIPRNCVRYEETKRRWIGKVDSITCGAEWIQAAPCSFEGYLQYVADLNVTVICFMVALHCTAP